MAILGDPGADSGGKRKSNRAGKYGTKKSKERGSSRRSLLFFVPYFSARLDFLLPPLSAPGSPRMFNGLSRRRQVTKTVFLPAVQNMSHFSMYVFKHSSISCQLCQYLGQYLVIACCT